MTLFWGGNNFHPLRFTHDGIHGNWLMLPIHEWWMFYSKYIGYTMPIVPGVSYGILEKSRKTADLSFLAKDLDSDQHQINPHQDFLNWVNHVKITHQDFLNWVNHVKITSKIRSSRSQSKRGDVTMLCTQT